MLVFKCSNIYLAAKNQFHIKAIGLYIYYNILSLTLVFLSNYGKWEKIIFLTVGVTLYFLLVG
jgi:hypothetical protein